MGNKQNDYPVLLIIYQLIVFASFKSRLKKKQMRYKLRGLLKNFYLMRRGK